VLRVEQPSCWGWRPDAAIGYSSAESAALAALGRWQDSARPATAILCASDLFLVRVDLATSTCWRRA
jgi:hypothetical protein